MKEVMEEYYDKYSKQVYLFLCQLTGNTQLSEELTQETFYQALSTIQNFNGSCKPSVWLCQIAKHMWYRHLEKSKDEILISMDTIENQYTDNNLEQLICNKEDKIELYREINSLKKDMKEVVYLRLTGDLTFVEIAEVLYQSESWARVNYHRAKNELRRCLNR